MPVSPTPPALCFSAPAPWGFPTTLLPQSWVVSPREAADRTVARNSHTGITLDGFYSFLLCYNHFCKKEENKNKRKKTRTAARCPGRLC